MIRRNNELHAPGVISYKVNVKNFHVAAGSAMYSAIKYVPASFRIIKKIGGSGRWDPNYPMFGIRQDIHEPFRYIHFPAFAPLFSL